MSTTVFPTSTMDEATTIHLTVDGFEREALLFSPGSIAQTSELPLVFVFHWHGGTMTAAAMRMGLQILWPEAVVVYPQGLPTKTLSNVDPAGIHPGWQSEANQPGIGNRDVHFVAALRATVEQQHAIDDKRVYVCGFSNGAGFSYLLWALHGDGLAAIGECAGRTWPTTQLVTPRPLLAIGGRADTVDDYANQEATIQLAIALNAAGPRQSCGQADPGNPLSPDCTLYPSALHAPVKTLIHDGAHVYPSWASGEIVRFFKAHALP
jgi:polyhydroxybutyrate depolymerase